MTDSAEPVAAGVTAPGKPDAPAPAQPALGPTQISVSRGLADWLRTNRTSFAFTSYQTGQLFLVGLLPNGSVSFNQQNFTRAMGVCYQPGRLYLGSLFQIWRLENMLRPGRARQPRRSTSVLVPRNAQTTGDIDVHEVGTDASWPCHLRQHEIQLPGDAGPAPQFPPDLETEHLSPSSWRRTDAI